MSTIHWDSELMTNYAEAVNFPAGKKLSACVDALNKQPAVFSLSNHSVPKLQLIRVDKDGRRVLLDLGQLLEVPAAGFIETFGMHQSDDLTIFLSFSVQIDERQSNLWIVRPFKLTEDLSLNPLPVRAVGRVHDIQMGPYAADGSRYPAIYLMHQPLNRTAANSDLAQIRIDLGRNDWEQRKELTLPQNVQKILDIAPTYAGFFGHGLFYLCEHHGKRSIYAVLVRPGEELDDRGTATLFQFDCPEDATSIATFTDHTDKEKRSSVLVGCGAGIYHIPSKKITAIGGYTKSLLGNADCLKGARELFVSQTGRNLSVFALNAKNELAFLTTTLTDLDNVRAAPILPEGTVSAFSAMTAAKEDNVQHSLICNDASGNLLLLRQALDTGIWRDEPFFVETSGEMTPFESYTVTITAKDSKKNPLVNGKAWLQSSSMLPIIINGRSTSLTPAGDWYDLDNAGEIGVIIPAKTMACQPITINGLQDHEGEDIEISTTLIDPTSKVLARMGDFSDPAALLKAKTPEGETLWDEKNKPSEADLKSAAECFSAIKDAYKTLPKDGSVLPVVGANAPRIANGLVKELGNPFMDAFLWITHKAQQAIDWAVRKAGQVWEFVCTIGGKVMNFVLDCIEKVTEAASWVWDKLKVGWNKLCKFVGFLFSWTDILETKDSIVGFLNAGLDTVANRVEGFNSKIDRMFSDAQKVIGNVTGATSKPEFKEKLNSKKRKEDKDMDNLQDSAPSKWAGERMKNGNAKHTVESKKSTTGAKKTEAELVDVWNDRIKPIVGDFNKVVEDLAKDVAALFKEDKNLSQEALLSRLGGNLLVNILEIVKKLLQAVVSIVAKVVLVVKKFGNLKLSSGFLNSLYRFISRGKDLTIFEAVSLLIAIPSTFIIKLVTGAKPPAFKKIDANLVESIIAAKNGENVSSTSLVKAADKDTLKDAAILMLGCGCGAALIKVFYKNIKVAYKTVTGGVSVGVGAMPPSAIFEIFGMVIDAIAIYKDFFVEPVDADTPGADLIQIATAVKCFRLVVNALYMIAAKLGWDNPAAEQVVLCIDLISALINFSLYSAVYAKQLDATSWEGHDEETLVTATVDNFLEALSTIGYCTAATFKEKLPHASVVGMICFQLAAWGGVVTKGVSFKSEFSRM